MKKIKIIISAMFFLFFIISAANFAVAEDENITISDPKGDVLVYDLLDIDYNFTTTDEVPNIDLKHIFIMKDQKRLR